MAEDKKLSVTVSPDVIEDENLKKFQQLLAYFVWHLEYMNDESVRETAMFCNKERTPIAQQGQGYDGNTIQECIKEWELLKDGRVLISVQNASKTKSGKYESTRCYLNWAGLADNVSIYAVWEGNENDKEYKNHIKGLYIQDKWESNSQSLNDVKKWRKKTIDSNEWNCEPAPKVSYIQDGYYCLSDLGICLNNNPVNINSISTSLKKFYQAFVKATVLEPKAFLENAKNIIFTGAPGTGKTYLAKQIAKQMGAQYEFVQFHPSYDYTDFVEGLRPVKNGKDIVFERKDGIFKAFCEKALKQWLLDLLQKSNPQGQGATNDNEVYKKIWLKLNGFTIKDEEQKGEDKDSSDVTVNDNQIAAIKELLESLIDDNKSIKKTEIGTQNKIIPFVFIIDEINRGEISKIFGELFFSVDPGYRGVEGKVKTQYANLQEKPNLFDLVLLALRKIDEGDWGHFFIPENVYIIGTMNDIDRSVESMDFAFRRRFTFREIKAKDTQAQILNSMNLTPTKVENLVRWMDNLNNAISNTSDAEFSEAYHIGAAYFKHYTDYTNQDKPHDKIWNNHIKGVLFEYLRGKPNADVVLGKWKAAYDGNATDDSIEDNQE